MRCHHSIFFLGCTLSTGSCAYDRLVRVDPRLTHREAHTLLQLSLLLCLDLPFLTQLILHVEEVVDEKFDLVFLTDKKVIC